MPSLTSRVFSPPALCLQTAAINAVGQQPAAQPAIASATAPLSTPAPDPHAGRRPPPPGYVCHRCGLPGHWIQNCPGPTGNGPVPVSAAIELQSPTSSSAAAAAAASSSLPAELLCPLCHTLYQQAVVMPCCFASYCDECIRQALLWDGSMQCPSCHHQPVDLQQLRPNVQLQKTVDAWKQSREEQKDAGAEQRAAAAAGGEGQHALSAAAIAAGAMFQPAAEDDLMRVLADPSAGQVEHSRRRAGPFRCHRCGEIGHKQAQCLNMPPHANAGFYPMMPPHELQGGGPGFYPGMDPMLAQMQAGGLYDGYGGGWMPSMQEQMMMSPQQMWHFQQQQQQLMGMGGGGGGAWMGGPGPGWGMGGMYGGGAGPMGLMQPPPPPFMQQQSNTMPMQPLPPFHHPHPQFRPPHDLQQYPPPPPPPPSAGQRPSSPSAQLGNSDAPQQPPALIGVQATAAETSSDSGVAAASAAGGTLSSAPPSTDGAALSSSSPSAAPSEALSPSERPATQPVLSSSTASAAASSPSSAPSAATPASKTASPLPAVSSALLTVQSYCYLPATWNGAARSLLLLTLGPPPLRRVLHASSLLPGSAFRLSSGASRLQPGVHLLTASGIPPRGASSSLLLSLQGLEEWRRREGEEGAVRMAADWKARAMPKVLRWMRGELRLEETSAALPVPPPAAAAAPAAAPAVSPPPAAHRKVEADANGGLRMRVTRRDDRQEEDRNGPSKRRREQDEPQQDKSVRQDTQRDGQRSPAFADSVRDKSDAVTVTLDADDRYRPPPAADDDDNDIFALVMRE